MVDPPLLRRRALWFAAGFAVLAALVQATDFDRLNGFALRHLQPIAAGKGHPRLNSAAEALIVPGTPAIAVIAIGLAALLLWRSDRRREALAWPAALLGGFVVEIGSKLVISQQRSGIWHGYGLTLDSSFPSGHMLRVILVAGALAALWPVLHRPLEWYCAVVAVCLLITGWHLPTDITGGVMAGVALLFWAESYRPRSTSSTTSCASSSSSPRTARPMRDPARTSDSRS